MNIEAWVGCLGCYNEGTLTGRWVDGSTAADPDLLICKREDHEELWVFDHDATWLIPGECSPQQMADLASVIEDLNDREVDVLRAYLTATSEEPTNETDLRYHMRNAEETFTGEYDSLGDFAEDQADSAGYLDARKPLTWPFTYIDWERAGEELAQDYVYTRYEGKLWFFWNH